MCRMDHCCWWLPKKELIGLLLNIGETVPPLADVHPMRALFQNSCKKSEMSALEHKDVLSMSVRMVVANKTNIL